MTQDQFPQGIQLGRILAGETHMDVVYFLAMHFRGREAVKIGTSTRLKTRIGSVSYAAELEDVLLLVPGGHDIETLFHDRFREYQIPPYAELFWRDGQLGAFLAMAPPVSFAAAFAARVRRRFTKNPKAKPEPEYEPQLRPEPQPEPQPEPEAAPDPGPEAISPDAPMGLSDIAAAGLVSCSVKALRMDRHRSDLGELPDGLKFPEPVGLDGQKELFDVAEVQTFDALRRKLIR